MRSRRRFRQGARAPPGRDGRADRDRARRHEGRRDEGRPGALVRRPRPRARGVSARSSRRSSPPCATRRRRSRSSEMRKVIEQDLGEPPATAFAELDPAPVAAASIGQVYRGRLHDGRDVAIKVQYPGVNDAVRADMQNLGMLMRLAKRSRRRWTSKRSPTRSALGSSRSSTTSSRRPTTARSPASTAATRSSSSRRVVTEMCRERVIVTEFVEGDRFEQLTSDTGRAGPDRRDRLPLLLRLDVPPPPLLGRPAPRQHDPHGRREGRVHRLRPLQGDRPARDGGRARDGPRRIREATPRSSTACGPRTASSPSPRRSAPTSCWRTRSTRSGGTRRTRKPRSPARPCSASQSRRATPARPTSARCATRT